MKGPRSPMELENEWTFDQAMSAHALLDAFAMAEANARARAEATRNRPTRGRR